MISLRIMTVALGCSVLVLAAQASVAQTTADDIGQDVGELAESIRDYSVERRDELLEKSRTTLEQVDARIIELQSEMDEGAATLSAQAREKQRATLQSLRETRTEVAEWYGALRHGSKDAWGEIRSGFSGAWGALRDALAKDKDKDKEKDEN